MSENEPSKSYSYEQAGVSIAAGNALVKAIAPQAQLDETLVLRAARRVSEQLLEAQAHGRD